MHRGAYLLLILCFTGLGQLRADEPVVFRSDVALVRVDAQVVDGSNRAITGLGIRDFVLRENGTPQRIQSVDSESLPLDLVLLLDVSASMRPHIERISTASHEAMRQLREQDRVAILVFDRYTRTRMAFRSNKLDVERELERLLDQESFNGGTDITRGMLDAADYLRREGRREARKAIVIVTDDETERNRDVEGVSRALTRADAVLSALIAPDAIGTGRGRRGGYPGGGGRYPGGGGGYPGGGGGPLGGPLGGIIFGRRGPNGGQYPGGGYPGGGSPGGVQIGGTTHSAGTEEIARRSGGDAMPVDDSYSLSDTLARIRQRYALHFYLPPGVRAGEERTIEVQLADAAQRRYPGAEVRYRRDYYAPSGSGAARSGGNEPVVVSQSSASDGASATGDDPDRPRLKRRPGVSQTGGSREGPLGTDETPVQSSGSASSAPAGGWQKAEPAQTPAPAPTPDAPGWRKADPGQSQSAAPAPAAPGWRKARPEDYEH